MLRSTASVIGRDEDSGDGKQVPGKIMFIVPLVCISTVNHDPSASFREDVLQDVVSNARKSVAVHDHNFGDQASEYMFQKGTKPFPLEVDPRRDVADDRVVRVRLLEVMDLAFEISLLFGAADSGVDVRALVRTGVLSNERIDTIEAVHSLSAREPDVLEASGLGPGSKGAGGYAILR